MAELVCDVGTAESVAVPGLPGSCTCASPSSPRWTMEELIEVATAPAALVEAEVTTMATMPSSVTVLEAARRAVATPSVVAAPPVPGVPAPSAPPQCNSTVEAARRRVRGPTITEQREKAAVDAERAEQRKVEQRKAPKRKAATCEVAETEVVPPHEVERRGRARMNAPLATGTTAPAGSEFAQRHRGLEAAGEFRRSKAMRAVAPAGSANFASAPDPPRRSDTTEICSLRGACRRCRGGWARTLTCRPCASSARRRCTWTRRLCQRLWGVTSTA